MKRLRLAVSLLALCGLSALATPLAAQSPEIVGTFQLDTAKSDDIRSAIDRGVAKMNFMVRGIARARLMKSNVPDQRLVIAQTATTVTKTDDSGKPVTTPNTGQAVDYEFDGEILALSTLADGKRIVEQYEAKDGVRRNTYRLSPEGNLMVSVTVSSDRLPEDIQYQLVYRRVK